MLEPHDVQKAIPTTRTGDDDLSEADTQRLLLYALCGGGGQNVAGAIEAVVIDLEVLYEALDAHGERWATSSLHLVQCRLRVVAELARRAPATRAA